MSDGTDIAVVGIGCRYPDASTPQEFWRNIDSGRVSMRDLTDEDLHAVGVPERALHAPGFVRTAAVLPGAADFAAEFFGVPPTEAETTDPQHRIFLETCWEALEAAGHPPSADGPVVGVFAGSAPTLYSAALLAEMTRTHGLKAAMDDLGLTLGGLGDLMPSRVAYKLGLRGPAVGVQTACSSSLYAVHYATLSLLSGECDIALAGGTTVTEPVTGYRYQPGGLSSEDGYCRSFDAGSTGTAFSSGVGVVALRRLQDALADGDPVLAVVRGTAVGNEGAERPGFTAPTRRGVADVVATALRVADVDPDLLRYVEAHGSGTALGDHIELVGLTDGLRSGSSQVGYCRLGSVKANVGHTGSAAGITGFIKAVHIARTGSLPPQPMFERPRDPGILADSPFVIETGQRVCEDTDRHVLVNSMGVGGTNVAAVLAPPPEPVRPPAEQRPEVRLLLSARTRKELDALSRELADHLEAERPPVADVAHTLRTGRHHFAERRVVTAAPERLAAALRLPRPPFVMTTRAEQRRGAALLLLGEAAGALDTVSVLEAALPAGTLVLREGAETPAGAFVIQIGGESPGGDHHVLSAEADAVDAALSAAWAAGVPVDWEAAAQGRGRRIALPTYPFTRRRYWALDRMPPVTEPVEPAAPVREETAPDTSADSLEEGLLTLWRELFGTATIGLDEDFGSLGGTSLLYVRMALEIQERYGVLLNMHRAGGSRTTVRRIAEIVRGHLGGGDEGYRVADGDGPLIDEDLSRPLSPLADRETAGRDILLTGATGFLGAFLLSELVSRTSERIHCLVRARDEEHAWRRLREAAESYGLPAPPADRVRPVPGDLRTAGEALRGHDGGALNTRVGHVLHCGARVVFTEPYRVLRDDNLLPVIDLVNWARENGIQDFSLVSTVAATGHAMGEGSRILETREQPLDPEQGGYGVSKWVAERLLERAERDGMRVRIFRPGVILGSTDTGACNDKDLIWHILASGLAVGARPVDPAAWPVAPVDLVARAIVELSRTPGSVGRAYHLAHERLISPQGMFELLPAAGLPTEAVELEEWRGLVAKEALSDGSDVLSNMALYGMEGEQLGEDDMQTDGWQPWLRENGLSPAPTGELLLKGLNYLARGTSPVGTLLGKVLDSATFQQTEEGSRR
ncbi:thioester reductase domain-containing protein [Streptomyces sp. NPDC019396]|uniref:thioester reductase domain-containing protein n=1 Tax=Streptomyces sp. NPDC019396 TaxID=3154687 RepID=UPI00340CD936